VKGTLVVLSSIHWNFTWQRHQSLAAGLARKGYEVVFVEPLPKRWPRPREIPRLLGRVLGRPGMAGLCPQRVPEGVRLASPRLLPEVGRFGPWWNRTFLLGRVVDRVRRSIPRRPLVLLNYLPTRASLALQRALEPDLKVYDCAWDWSNDPYSEGLAAIEEELVREVDLVLTDSPRNTERMRRLHPRVVRLLHGVDYDLFAREREDDPTPSEAVCAYFGDLGENIDVGLLARVSRLHPLHLIGPVRVKLRGFSGQTRVWGAVPHEQVPERIRPARVLLLPYRDAPHTRAVFPAKIMECLATGKPTVATHLESLEEFADLLYLRAGPDEFLRAIDEAASEDPARREPRRRFARANTWSRRIDEVEALLETRPR
jgi:glycosyltransferase involved in cell wall biosynthesis